MTASERRCHGCEVDITHKHPNARYCERSCRERYDYANGTSAKIRERNNSWYAANAESVRAQKKTYRRENAEAIAQRTRARYWADPYKYRAATRAFNRANPDKKRAWDARKTPQQRRGAWERRRARLRQAQTYTFTERDWQTLVTRYRGCCAYCGVESGELHRDHVIPLVRGGSHGVGNILPACPRCNLTKGTSLLIEWKLRLRERG